MSRPPDHRYRPITNAQALLGALGVAGVIAAIIALSHALQVPVEQVPAIPAVEPDALRDPEQRPGAVNCPPDRDVEARGDPAEVTSVELIDCPELFDGRRVTLSGEAVGAVLRRDARAWVHLNDDVYGLRLGPLSRHRVASGGNSGIAVNVPVEVAHHLLVGGARRHGDGVAVVGVYHRAAPFDGGGPAIWADTAEIVRRSEPVEHPISVRRAVVAVVLAGIAGALAALSLRRRA